MNCKRYSMSEVVHIGLKDFFSMVGGGSKFISSVISGGGDGFSSATGTRVPPRLHSCVSFLQEDPRIHRAEAPPFPHPTTSFSTSHPPSY